MNFTSVSNVFYHPNVSDISYLNSEESAHAIRVLRLKKNDEIFLVDGKGGLFKGRITQADQKTCTVNLIEDLSPKEKETVPALHIAVAPTKNLSRFEWFLEKATEIGIKEITPLICDHSERRNINIGRLEKILIAAMKQSRNLYLPVLNQPSEFHDFVSKNSAKNQKYIAHYSEIHLKNLYQKGNDVLVLIGPEGDFSGEEIAFARSKGYTIASLGKNRLRTETAAVLACHTIKLINEK